MYRLKSLRHVSQSETDELLKREEFVRSYLRELHLFADLEEPEEQRYWNRELRNEIAHLAIEAYRRELVSRGRILDKEKGLLISEIDVDAARSSRRKFDASGHYARPDVFSLIVNRAKQAPVTFD